MRFSWLLAFLAAMGGCGRSEPAPESPLVQPVSEDSDLGGDSEASNSLDSESADTDTGDSNSDSENGVADSDTLNVDTDGGNLDLPALTHFGEESGLGAGLVWNDLTIEPDGRVLGATSNGLLVFDGFSSVFSGALDGLAADDVAAIGVAEDGEIWVGFDKVVGVDGQRLRLDAGGRPTGLASFDITRTGEISEIHRFAEQSYGIGAADLWMGSNEGLCVFDREIEVYAEHLHPTHPHLDTLGVAITLDGHIWNGDQYQLSRWMYDHDGSVSSTGNLVEYGSLWDAGGEPIEIRDLAANGMDVWVASAVYGVARVDAFLGIAEADFFAPDTLVSAHAIEVEGDGDVWVGDALGLVTIDSEGAAIRIAGVTGSIEQLAMDRADGILWAAGSNGLWRLIPGEYPRH